VSIKLFVLINGFIIAGFAFLVMRHPAESGPIALALVLTYLVVSVIALVLRNAKPNDRIR
jgi:hypothetical protein